MNFGEKSQEYSKKDKKKLDVWVTDKYKSSKKKAIELIESKKYDLDVSDFWILMNKAGDKMAYTGLIMSHNGCLKVNDKLSIEYSFKPECVSFHRDDDVKVLQYCSPEQGIFEFGEVSPSNLMNSYPYAMLLKRLMDRVILKNSKISFYGIYSESESEDFKKEIKEIQKEEDLTDLKSEVIKLVDKLGLSDENTLKTIKAIKEGNKSSILNIKKKALDKLN